MRCYDLIWYGMMCYGMCWIELVCYAVITFIIMIFDINKANISCCYSRHGVVWYRIIRYTYPKLRTLFYTGFFYASGHSTITQVYHMVQWFVKWCRITRHDLGYHYIMVHYITIHAISFPPFTFYYHTLPIAVITCQHNLFYFVILPCLVLSCLVLYYIMTCSFTLYHIILD